MHSSSANDWHSNKKKQAEREQTEPHGTDTDNQTNESIEHYTKTVSTYIQTIKKGK